jgi:hypothetical protein
MINLEVEYKGFGLEVCENGQQHWIALTDTHDGLYFHVCMDGATRDNALEYIFDYLDGLRLHQSYHSPAELEKLTDWEAGLDGYEVAAAQERGLWNFVAGTVDTWLLEEPDRDAYIDLCVEGYGMTMHELETDDGEVLLKWLVDNFDGTYEDCGKTLPTLEQCEVIYRV